MPMDVGQVVTGFAVQINSPDRSQRRYWTIILSEPPVQGHVGEHMTADPVVAYSVM